MRRCAECKWWDRIGTSKHGQCEAIEATRLNEGDDDEAIIVQATDINVPVASRLVTRRTFGCALHEERDDAQD